jgi:hypothetical protein
MRLVKVSVPQGQGVEIAEIAFRAGVASVSHSLETSWRADGQRQVKDVVNARTSTPVARRFLDSLRDTHWGTDPSCIITVRQPQSIGSAQSMSTLTRPMGVPTHDLRAELWQFSHITPSFVGRIVCATLLLADGLARNEILTILGGLLFMPLLPTLMAISLGALCRDGGLVRHGLRAWLTALALIIATSTAYARLAGPPLLYPEHSHWPGSLMLSALVGLAAALADVDDAGKKEMLGLAATSQLAVLATWSSLAYSMGAAPPLACLWKLGGVLLNASAIVLTSCLCYHLVGVRCSDRQYSNAQAGCDLSDHS